jgi:hypothetical protein
MVAKTREIRCRQQVPVQRKNESVLWNILPKLYKYCQGRCLSDVGEFVPQESALSARKARSSKTPFTNAACT